MPSRSSIWATKTIAVFTKDLRSELRTRYSLNALFMFAFTTLVAVSFSIGQLDLSTGLQAALFWIIIFFSSMSALAGVFVREEDTGTGQTLRLFAQPSVIYAGKLLYNIALLFLLCLVLTPLYIVFLDVEVLDWGVMLTTIALGVIGLAGATTIVGAIVAKAAVRGALFAVLSFPILLPLLILAIRATTVALEGSGWALATGNVKLLAAYAVIMITASTVLFDFVWNG